MAHLEQPVSKDRSAYVGAFKNNTGGVLSQTTVCVYAVCVTGYKAGGQAVLVGAVRGFPARTLGAAAPL